MILNRSQRARLALILLSVITLLSGCGEKVQPVAPAAPSVGVYEVRLQPLTLTSELPGRTAAYRIAQVRPQVNGIIEERLFVEGSDVNEGQQLYQIDSRTYEARLARAEANLVTSANLARRYKGLRHSNSVSQQQYDDAVALWHQAQAEVQLAKIDVQYTKVTAPISGQIGRSAVTEGALVTNGQARELATVTQLDPIYVDVTQPITKLLDLQQAMEAGRIHGKSQDHMEVSLTLGDGSSYPLKGVLKFSEVHVDSTTDSVTLRTEFPNPHKRLLPGMFVRAELNEGVVNNALLIPQQAVTRDLRGKPFVWLVNSDNTVTRQEIETLRTVGNSWLVGNGIEAGDHIITEGLQRVREGIVVETEPATNLNLVASFKQPTSSKG